MTYAKNIFMGLVMQGFVNVRVAVLNKENKVVGYNSIPEFDIHLIIFFDKTCTPVYQTIGGVTRDGILNFNHIF